MTDTCAAGAAFRYEPPRQVVARAVTCVGEVVLEFVLSFAGSLLIVCGATDGATDGATEGATEGATDGEVAGRPDLLRRLGAALQRLGHDTFVSAVHVERLTVESALGHRFIHASSSVDARTRRFAGECVIELGAPDDEPAPTVTGSLTYSLDVTAAAASDPPSPAGGDRWSDSYDRQLGAIGAIVLEPVPVTAERAARLFVA